MKTTLEENQLFTLRKSDSDIRKFLILGDTEGIPKPVIEEKIQFGTAGVKAEAIWGTIGWEDNVPFTVEGEIKFSKEGQTDSALGATLHEIEDLYAITPGLTVSNKNKRVTERYIDLSSLRFKLPKNVKLDELPKIRLNIFLKNEEGALVFYQHSDRKNYADKDAFIEYILPHKTDTTNSFDRYKLQYTIPIIPESELDETSKEGVYKLSSRKNTTGFIVKVLTFIREGSNSNEAFSKAVELINGDAIKGKTYEWVHEYVGSKKYKLRIFNPKMEYTEKDISYGGAFVEIDDANRIDPNKKTLLLLHGTWSSTNGSFKHLIAKSGLEQTEASFLQNVLINGDYGQVLSFDRPTMSANVYTNIDYFFTHLGAVKFQLPLDIITTSQGAMVAEALSSHEKTKEHFKIRRVLMFSAANGCGYFKTADHIGTLLGVLRKNSTPGIGKVLLAAAQHSADWFVSNPGLKQMHPDDALLAQILNATPNDQSTEYINVVSDWDRRLMNGSKRILRLPAGLLDALIKLSLGSRHDWVIGCDAQEKYPVKSKQKEKVQIVSMHGKYMDLGHVMIKRKLLGFRNFDSHAMIIEKLLK